MAEHRVVPAGIIGPKGKMRQVGMLIGNQLRDKRTFNLKFGGRCSV